MNFNAINLSDIKLGKENSVTIEKTSNRDIAIIGVSADLPFADDVDTFWENLEKGMDCIRRFPQNRKADSDVFMSYINTPERQIEYCQAGYLNEIDKFDYNFFHIPPKEANLMDPNQRLFLQSAWKAIEDAGYGGEKLRGSRTGVYVGYSGWPIYGQLISQTQSLLAPISTTGNISSIIASRISYLLDLRGPSMLVDTACSSSLVAIYLACQGIRNGECDMAITGGIKISFIEIISRRRAGIGIDSSDYRTRAFDEDSDGASWGEGIITFILKPLNKAIKDNDNIYAVIKGAAINQDGNSIGITAPNVAAQEDVIVRAWSDANIDPSTISYIEAHGTGTKLGDPIEIEGIGKAFARYTDKKQFCAIGSVKTNIGHLDSAAGAAGLLKVVLALNHKKLPPSLHFNKPNSKIEFENSPVYVNDKLTKWEATGSPRRCGVSSFGLSGTNCHIVVEEAPEINKKRNESGNSFEILTLSAKSESSLKRLMEKYEKYLDKNTQANLKDICYTANIGRGSYSYRLALVIKDINDLKEKIRLLLEKGLEKSEEQGIYFGIVKTVIQDNGIERELQEDLKRLIENTDIKIEKYVASGKADRKLLNEMCEMYIKGAQIQWEKFYRIEKRWRTRIPAYPFEMKRCWFEIPSNDWTNKARVSVVSQASTDTGAGNILIKVALTGRISGEEYGEQERRLAQIWSDVLGYAQIDINQGFYELGGDSLSATMIVARIHKELGYNITLSDFLMATSFKELALQLAGNQGTGCAAIKRQPERDYYEISSAQKRVYIMNELETGSTLYNQPNAFIVEGYLNLSIFQTVFEKLIERHESLRTCFKTVNGEIVQKVCEKVEFKIEYEESDYFEPETIIKEFIRPFDIHKAPLMRAKLSKIKDGRYLFIYDIHHIIADGWSLNILIEEFNRLINGEELPELSIQYKDFAAWQNEFLKSEDIKKQEKYWLSEFLSDIPLLNLPVDFERPSVQSFEGKDFKFEIDDYIYNKIKEFAIESDSTFFVIFLAVYSILLSRYCEQEDIIIGSPVAGRLHADLKNIIGMFANTVAIRTQPKSDITCREFLQHVKSKVVLALENQDYQFEILIDTLSLPRDISRHPVFDTMLVYDNAVSKEFSFIGDKSKFIRCEFERKKTKFDIILHIVPRENSFECELIYSSRLFKYQTMQNIGQHFTDILREFLEIPDRQIGAMGLSGSNPNDRQTVTEETNNMIAEFDF